jgi:hypothetical protein
MTATKFLEDWAEVEPLAAEVNKHPRTINRWMSGPDGLPYTRLGNKRFIHRPTFHEWLLARMKRPNPRRNRARLLVRNKQGGTAGDGTPSKQETGLERPTSTRSPQKVQARADDADSVTPFALQVTYATTQDNFSGEPWPPDGNDYWAVVARARGFTKWRRITLVETTDKQSGAVTLDDGLHLRQRLKGK